MSRHITRILAGSSRSRWASLLALLVAGVLLGGIATAAAVPPSAPPVTNLSATPHASDDVWYSSASPTFWWSSGQDADGYSYTLDRRATDPSLDTVIDPLGFYLSPQDPMEIGRASCRGRV